MNDTKQKADALVEKHYTSQIEILNKNDIAEFSEIELKISIKAAIIDTKNTIEVLEGLTQPEFRDFVVINQTIKEQTEILKELESRI